ncbi:MAG: hypothetical protein JKY52_19130 [Flavobacteriales bacterium]|nr:hypothetical protein [Flavobacteriales bacterium]
MTCTRILNTYKRLLIREALLLALIGLCQSTSAQSQWVSLDRVCKSSLRGLSVVSDNVVWASGSNGTWLRTVDGGERWTSGIIPGTAKLDFRDIHALDSLRAWVISAGDTCKIFHTTDGGISWTLQYTNFEKGIFFDGFSFWDEKTALAYSDPINGKFYIIKTTDGNQWTPIDAANIPPAIDGEAGFAASGTGICVQSDSVVWIATGGGPRSRVLRSLDRGHSWSVHDTPLQSAEGTGIFSMVFTSTQKGVIVGGSYLDSTNTESNCAITDDAGETWVLITKNQPRGYRSCVAVYRDGSVLVTVGRTGSELSDDHGQTWIPIGTEGYFTCAFSEHYVWAVGRNGKIGKLILETK